MAYSSRINDADGTRTDAEAKENIQVNTAKENKAKPVIEAYFRGKGKIVEVLDYDKEKNTGRFISPSEATRKGIRFDEADWKLLYNGSILTIEAKVHSISFPCCSFKKEDLHKVIKAGEDAAIFIIRQTYFDIYPSSTCELLMQRPMAPLKNMGMKMGIRLYDSDIVELLNAELILRKHWNKEALSVLNPLVGELFR